MSPTPKKRKTTIKNVKLDKMPEYKALEEFLSHIESDDSAISENISELIRLSNLLSSLYDSVGTTTTTGSESSTGGILQKIQHAEQPLESLVQQLMQRNARFFQLVPQVLDTASEFHVATITLEKQFSNAIFELLTVLKEFHSSLDPRVSKFQEAGFGIKNESLQEFLKELEISEAILSARMDNLGVHNGATEPMESIVNTLKAVLPPPPPTDSIITTSNPSPVQPLLEKFSCEAVVHNLYSFSSYTMRARRETVYLIHATLVQVNTLLHRIYDNHGSWPQVENHRSRHVGLA